MERYLAKIGFDSDEYLKRARRKAKAEGYNPNDVYLSKDGNHKIAILTPEGKIVRFGRVGYGDYIIYTYLEQLGEVPDGYASRKRYVFQKSHTALSQKRNITSPYAPNNLALAILW